METDRGSNVRHYRARQVRTNASLLVNSPDGFPSAQQPAMWWFGYDSGAGSTPIGPNGPWTGGAGGVSAVTRATALIVDPLAQVPWGVQRDGMALPLSDVPRWLSDPMLVRPDLRTGPSPWPHAVRQTRASFWANVLRSALWWGMGPVIYQVGTNGQPVPGSLYQIHRHSFDVHRPGGPTSAPVYKIGGEVETDSEGRFEMGGTQWDTIVMRNPLSPIDEDGRSFGVFEMHPATFGLQARMQEYELGTFRTGVPAGYLKTTVPGLTQDQADLMKLKWLEAHGGDRRSIAVLNATTDFKPLTMTPVDTALSEMKSASLVDIANAFNLDANMINGRSGDSSTYANVESKYSNYRVHTLGRWQTDAEETFGALLPYGTNLDIRLGDLLRGDTGTRYSQYQAGIDGGWLTVEEVRAAEGLPPLTGTPANLRSIEGERDDDDAAA